MLSFPNSTSPTSTGAYSFTNPRFAADFPTAPSPVKAASAPTFAPAPNAPVATPQAPAVQAPKPQPAPAPLAATGTPMAPAAPQTITTPNGAEVDPSTGQVVTPGNNPPFSINTAGPFSATSLSGGPTLGDLYTRRQALEDSYLNAIKQYNQTAQNFTSAEQNAQYAGDTLPFAQGLGGRIQSAGALQLGALGNVVNANQQALSLNNTDISNFAEFNKPTTVGIGASLVNPYTGSSVYQSPYLYKPSAASIDTIAQQLLQSGQATNYADAYNMAQQVVTQSAQGNQGFASGQDQTQSPTYTNAMSLLEQGVPPQQVLSEVGRSATAKAYAQQALADFLQKNKGYNSVQAQGNAKAAVSLTDQKANTERAISAAESNFPLLLDVVNRAGVNDYNAPLLNELQRAFNNKLIGSGDMASFNALTASLQTEYSQILSRGGTVTDKTRGEAEQIVNGTIGYSALKDLYSTLQKESKNVIDSYDNEVNKLLTQKAQPDSAGASGGSSHSSLDPLGIL